MTNRFLFGVAISLLGVVIPIFGLFAQEPCVLEPTPGEDPSYYVVCNVCGDGEQDPDEECDDGNTIDGDGCSAYCEIENSTGSGSLDVLLETGPEENTSPPQILPTQLLDVGPAEQTTGSALAAPQGLPQPIQPVVLPQEMQATGAPNTAALLVTRISKQSQLAQEDVFVHASQSSILDGNILYVFSLLMILFGSLGIRASLKIIKS